jgi:hypothetical protein
MTDQRAGGGGFWSSLPGILTGIAAVLTASAGLFLALGPSSTHIDPVPSDQQPPTSISTNQPESSSMGPLEPGISYSQGDMYDRPAASAEECVQLCTNDNRCRAVTFIISQQRCWLKDRVNASQPSSDMISARKLP